MTLYSRTGISGSCNISRSRMEKNMEKADIPPGWMLSGKTQNNIDDQVNSLSEREKVGALLK